MEAAACASMGEFELASQMSAAAAVLASETGRPYDKVASAYGALVTTLQQGRVDQAIAAAEPALELIREHDIRFFFPLVGNQLGHAYALAGRSAESVPLLREALRVANDLDHVAARLNAATNLAFALMQTGDAVEAEDLATSALDTSRQQGFTATRTSAAQLLAVLMARRGAPATDVESLFAEAVVTAASSEARPSLAHAHLALARYRLQQGQPKSARQPLIDATRAFREMEMSSALCQALSLAEIS